MSSTSINSIPHVNSELSSVDVASSSDSVSHSEPVPSSSGSSSGGSAAGSSTPSSSASALPPKNPFDLVTTPRSESGQATELLRTPSSRRSRTGGTPTDLHITGTSMNASTATLPVPSPDRSESAVSVSASGGPSMPTTPVHRDAPSPRHPHSAPVQLSAVPVNNTFPVHAATDIRRPRGGPVELADRPQQPVFDDDETTEPSSTGNNTAEHNVEHNVERANMAEVIARFVQNTRRRLSSFRDSEDDDFVEGAIIAGYLHKLGRNGKWQKRWFETDGECLSYYKTSKRTKLLATLDLEKVGAIGIDESDRGGCSFSIQVLGRLYNLRADSRAACRDWVIMLNRVKEARMQQGNVKLVDLSCQQPPDLLDQGTNSVTPRIVVVSNRQRTRAVNETQEFERLMHPGADLSMSASTQLETKRRSTIGTVVLARWTKRKTSIQRLSTKLVKWARSVRSYGCGHVESVQLDRHVHPPGHDDHRRRPALTDDSKSPTTSSEALDAWIGKEASQSAAAGHVPQQGNSKPQGMKRGISVESEDDPRYIS